MNKPVRQTAENIDVRTAETQFDNVDDVNIIIIRETVTASSSTAGRSLTRMATVRRSLRSPRSV